MNASNSLRLLTASLVVLTSLAACDADEEFRSLEGQVELAVDTVEGQFPGYTVDREALAHAIEEGGASFAEPPLGPCPPPVSPELGLGQGEAEALEQGLDDQCQLMLREDEEEHTEIPQLGLDMREHERREDEWVVVDPVFPGISIAPLPAEQSEAGPERMIIPLGVEVPEIEECLELCLADYVGCSGDELSPFACADQISACVEDC